MRNALTIALLTLSVSQVMAVVPIPIKECTKTVVVDHLLQYNEKLRKDCMNLDTGEKMCVSINPGGINPPLVPKAKKVKSADTNAEASADKKKNENKQSEDSKATGTTNKAAKPVDVQDKKPVVNTDVKKDTPPAAVAPSAPAKDASNAATTSPNKQQQNTLANGVAASAIGITSSMMLAVAGAAFSAVYML
ncbi:hypothetical protein EC991_004742 [Linnemannia zychae]|nr:hypothetical protein EC991_004742 [Linnemannia zychae]